MSTITDAIKKRKKEVGEKEVQGLIPAVLDEPDVDVPKDRSFRRSAFIGAGILLVAAAAVSAAILFRGMPARRSASKKGGAPPRTASLTQPAREEVMAAPGDETKEVLPLPKTVSGAPPSSAKAATPPEPPPRPLHEESVVPQTKATAAPGPERPQPVREKTPPVAKTPSPPSQETPPVTSPISPERTAPKGPGVVSKPAAAPQTDPFAGINLQGIIRFDPAHPEVLINGKALKVGDSLNGIEVVEIGDDSVKLRHGSAEKTIKY